MTDTLTIKDSTTTDVQSPLHVEIWCFSSSSSCTCQQQSHDHLSTPHSTLLCMHYALPVSNNHTIISQLHTQHRYVCIMHCLSATITRSPLNSTLNTAMYALCTASLYTLTIHRYSNDTVTLNSFRLTIMQYNITKWHISNASISYIKALAI